MNRHEEINALLPAYLNNQLPAHQAELVEAHLLECPHCREDLSIWEETAAALNLDIHSASASVLDETLDAIHRMHSRPSLIQHTSRIILSQVPLVRKEIWTASALILTLGFIVTLLLDRAMYLYALAPFVSAGGLALLYGDHDPAHELALSAPVSQAQILLARFTLVFGYNLAILGILTALLPSFHSPEQFVYLIQEWLAPMTFLSILSLSLSILFDSGKAIAISYNLWLARFLVQQPELGSLFGRNADYFLSFWGSPELLVGLSFILFLAMLAALKRGFTLQPLHS